MDRDDLVELFAPFGPVTVKRMFGGFGISADGVTLAMHIQGDLYLKSDETIAGVFAAEGCAPFSYVARGKTVTVTAFRRIPTRLYDDPEELAIWARRSFATAQQAAARKAAKPARKTAKSPRGKAKAAFKARKG